MGYEYVEYDDEEKKEDGGIVLVNLCILDDEEDDEPDEPDTTDAWMENANRINESLNNIIDILERKKESYLQPHQDDDASLLESTILSFVATTCNQIEALRQAISSSNRDYVHHCAGIVSYLMATLKEEIANPFAKLQKQRARPAMSLWDTPLQCRLVSRDNPLDDDDDDDEEDREQRFLPRTPLPLVLPMVDVDFMDTYQHQPQDDFSKEDLQRPKSMFERECERERPPAPLRIPAKKLSLSLKTSMKKKEVHVQPLPYQHVHVQDPHEEEDYNNMLQQEALLLTATLQNDLDSVQQVEARMTEITTLLGQFSNLVSEQQSEITTIHETTVKSQQNVEKGHDHLVDATERTKKSQHYMAAIVMCMALWLLFFNTITP